MMKTLLAAAVLLTISLVAFGRGADKPTVTGKWHFVFETEGGDREFNSVLEQTGDKISGKWNVADGKPGSDVKGTFTEETMLLDFPMVSDEAGPGQLKLKGQFADDGSLVGDWAFADYNGKFKATRVKVEAPK